MHIEYLSLTNFRNFARLELTFPNGPVLLHGANAQGKTSLLEAIYYLATSNSPYTTADWQLINWRTENDVIPFTRISADVVTRRSPLDRIEITLVREQNGGDARTRKDVRLNGVTKRVMDLVGQVNVVLFLPRDLSLIEGSPIERRAYMNATLCQTDRAYCEALATFILNFLSRDPGVGNIKSSFALKQVKYQTALPLPEREVKPRGRRTARKSGRR